MCSSWENTVNILLSHAFCACSKAQLRPHAGLALRRVATKSAYKTVYMHFQSQRKLLNYRNATKTLITATQSPVSYIKPCSPCQVTLASTSNTCVRESGLLLRRVIVYTTTSYHFAMWFHVLLAIVAGVTADSIPPRI